jgi:hypothetical protein
MVEPPDELLPEDDVLLLEVRDAVVVVLLLVDGRDVVLLGLV